MVVVLVGDAFAIQPQTLMVDVSDDYLNDNFVKTK
jgi:hypothetical protein